MAKLRGFDFKALLLNHGEKFGAGVIVLLGLTGLATASWSPSTKQPSNLKVVTEATRSAWQANAFTDDKKAAFAGTPDVLALAEQMQSEAEDLEKFSTRNPWHPPIHLPRERRAAIIVLAPTDPESNAISMVMAEKPDAEEEVVEEITNPKKIDDGLEPEVGEEVKDIFGVAGGVAGRGLGGTGGGGGRFLLGMGGNRDKDDEEEAYQATGYAAGGYGTESYNPYGGMTSNDRKVRYHSGVSVRMIFPLLDQIRSVSQSLHLPQTDPQVTQAIDFNGFQIERKKAVAGTAPWSGEWESISTDEIGEILGKSLAYDLEVVNPSVTRSELTMPLPRLAAGKWTLKNASHSKLDDFKLDEEEQLLLDRYQGKLLEEAEKLKKMLPNQSRKAGFTQFMLNGSDLNRVVDDSTGVTDDLFEEMSQGKKDSKNKSKYDNKEELKKLINKSMSTGRVLLVRFMDFTCDRGNSYIYRVRLIMNNPNFNYPVDELEQPDLATQEKIFSDWSEPTAPAYVPQSYRYYAQRADNLQSVKIGMFYENEKAGTPVMANLEVRVGSRIGGKLKMEVVDLSMSVLEAQEVEFKSPDLLAAIVPSIKLNSSDSPELKSHIDATRGRKQLSDRITVVDSNGAIVTRYVGDSVSNGGQLRTEDQDSVFCQDILKLYEHLKQEDTFAAGQIYNVDDEEGGGGGGYGGGMSRGSALSGGGKKSRRKIDLDDESNAGGNKARRKNDNR